MASVVESLYEELRDYHNATGDSRAGALVSVLYDAAESAKTEEHKAQVESRKAAEKEASKAEAGGN
jgi:hypothetical protein